MNSKEEIKQIDLVISQLKALKSGIQKVEKLGDCKTSLMKIA